MNDAESAPSPNRFCRKFVSRNAPLNTSAAVAGAEVVRDERLSDEAEEAREEDARAQSAPSCAPCCARGAVALPSLTRGQLARRNVERDARMIGPAASRISSAAARQPWRASDRDEVERALLPLAERIERGAQPWRDRASDRVSRRLMPARSRRSSRSRGGAGPAPAAFERGSHAERVGLGADAIACAPSIAATERGSAADVRFAHRGARDVGLEHVGTSQRVMTHAKSFEERSTCGSISVHDQRGTASGLLDAQRLRDRADLREVRQLARAGPGTRPSAGSPARRWVGAARSASGAVAVRRRAPRLPAT